MHLLPQRILVGISICPQAKADAIEPCPADLNTVKQALALAERTGAAVRLAHVVDWIDQRAAEDAADLTDAIRARLGPTLDDIVQRAAQRRIDCSVVYPNGRPWVALMDEAAQWQADVIAVSPRRDELSFGDRLLHGSTTSRLLRGAPCPVWVVDPAADALPTRVLALVDRSEVSARVATTAAKLADALQADKHILHCLAYPDEMALHALPNAREAIAAYHQEERQRARADLERLAAEIGGDWTILLDEDWVVRRCPRIVREQGIDLVVLAGISQPRLAGMLLGTTAERLLQRLHVSTWVVRVAP